MRNWSGWWIIIAILIVVDLYVFTAVRFLSHNHSDKTRSLIFSLYWLVALSAITFIISFPYSQYLQEHIVLRNYVFAIIIGLFFAKMIASVFFLLDDIRRLAVWLMAKIFPRSGVDFTHESSYISRSAFLNS
jgi:hypothetical protein